MAPKSTASGSYGASTPANTPTTIITTTTAAPIAPRVRRRAKSRMTAQVAAVAVGSVGLAVWSIGVIMAMSFTSGQPLGLESFCSCVRRVDGRTLGPRLYLIYTGVASDALSRVASHFLLAVADSGVEPGVHDVHREVHADRGVGHQ